MAQYEGIFACPVCAQEMKIREQKSLVCVNRHSFDLARQGYVNLLLNPPASKYEKSMFVARQLIHASGFFAPLLNRMHQQIVKHISLDKETLKMLDAGCGEGSHLTQLLRQLSEEGQVDVAGVGIDIAKEAIQLATKHHAAAIWCVADLAQLPFAAKQFDVIINVLSPANYAQFTRILADDGIVVKVIPESSYLQELRSIFYQQTEKQVYSNEQTLQLFQEHFHLAEIERVQYKRTLEEEQIQQLIQMTPLSWGAEKAAIEPFMQQRSMEITVDYSLLIGSKKSI